MSKQEEIREGVAIKLYGWLHSSGSPDRHSKKVPEVVRTGYRKRADELLEDLASEGVVLKVDRELPINTCGDDYDCYESCHLIAQEDMLKAGYVAVEPLI